MSLNTTGMPKTGELWEAGDRIMVVPVSSMSVWHVHALDSLNLFHKLGDCVRAPIREALCRPLDAISHLSVMAGPVGSLGRPVFSRA